MNTPSSHDLHRTIVALERIGTGLLRIAKAAEDAVSLLQASRTGAAQ